MSINTLNNFPSSQKILKPSSPFYLFDVGARRGFHPIFNNFKPIVKIGFEPSKEECDFLNLNKNSDEHYYQVALGNNDESVYFYNTKNPGSSGMLEPNESYWSRFAEADNLEVISKDKIYVTTFDNFFNSNSIKDCDFIKIDTEGFDLMVLQGGVETLSKHSLGVMSEVYFNPIRKNLPFFGKTHELMEECGLSLYVLETFRNGKRKFTKHNNLNSFDTGQIVWGDAIFLRDPLKDQHFDNKFEWTIEKYKKLIFLYEIFNLNDCAYELIDFLNQEKLFNFQETNELRKLFIKKSLKNKFLNFSYDNIPLNKIMPKSLRKTIRKFI